MSQLLNTLAPNGDGSPASSGNGADGTTPQQSPSASYHDPDSNHGKLVAIAASMGKGATGATARLEADAAGDGTKPTPQQTSVTDPVKTTPIDEKGGDGKDPIAPGTGDLGAGGTEAPASTNDEAEFKSATQAMKLGKFSQKMIDALPREQVLGIGGDLVKTQKFSAQKINEANLHRQRHEAYLAEEAEKGAKLLEGSPPATPATPAPTGTPPATDPNKADIDVELDELSKDEFLDDSGKALIKIARQQQADIVELKASRVIPQGTSDTSDTAAAEDARLARESQEDTQCEVYRQSYIQNNPAAAAILRDEANFLIVKKQIFELADLPGFRDPDTGRPLMDRLLKSAVALTFQDKIEANRAKMLMDGHHAEMSGQPIAPSSTTSNEQGSSVMSENEILVQATVMHKDGKSKEVVHAWVNNQNARRIAAVVKQ